MRIRTIKPEFWSNEKLSELPEVTHMFAAALLNYADDEGYFNANPKLIQAALFPLREPSVSIHGMLTQLSNIGYLRLGRGSDGRSYGHIVNFSEHQKVNRPSPSKIKDLAIFSEDSVSAHEGVNEDSLPDQGSGIRDQGSGIREDARGRANEPDSSPSRKRKKRELSEEAQAVRAEIHRLRGIEYPPAAFDSLEARFRAKELSIEDALGIVRYCAGDRFWRDDVKLDPTTLFRPKHWPGLVGKARAKPQSSPTVRPLRPEDDDVYARLE